MISYAHTALRAYHLGALHDLRDSAPTSPTTVRCAQTRNYSKPTPTSTTARTSLSRSSGGYRADRVAIGNRTGPCYRAPEQLLHNGVSMAEH